MWNQMWSWIVAHKGSIMSFATIGSLWAACDRAWKWYRDRYDGKTLGLMTEAARKARLDHPTMNIALIPYKIGELAAVLKRSEEDVYESLRRLEVQGKVHEVRHGEWCLGNRTQREILDEQWSDKGRRGGRFNSR